MTPRETRKAIRDAENGADYLDRLAQTPVVFATLPVLAFGLACFLAGAWFF